MRVTVFDYGAGNLHSLLKAVAGPGRAIEVESDPHRLLSSDLLILPGVGSFPQAAARLAPARADLCAALRSGHPGLGICLGLQLLFDSSAEGAGEGLGLLAGSVHRLGSTRVPHMGWNRIDPEAETSSRWSLGLGYFAHSYVCHPENPDCVTAWTTHESERFPAMVRTARTLGVQFHPEKSSAPGIRFLRDELNRLEEAS